MRNALLMMGMMVVLLVASCASAGKDGPIRPRALAPGDTIALVAPARGGQEERIASTEARLREMGFAVKRAPNLTSAYGYLAGMDEERATALMDAWRDPEVDALFCITGGYGVTRILDRLDYEYIRRNPKILTGFSDITGLELAIWRRAGVVTFHAPTSHYVLTRNEKERPFATTSFWDAIGNDEVRGGARKAGTHLDVYTDDRLTTPMLVINPGRGTGRLVGGNLSLVHALMGTPYEIETDGNVLFLEDVGEEPYRIDRMLSTLRLAGKLDRPAAVVLGVFRGCEAEDPESSFPVEELFRQYFAGRPYPVIANFPVGHVEDNATLPMGARAEVDAAGPMVRILESGVAGRTE